MSDALDRLAERLPEVAAIKAHVFERLSEHNMKELSAFYTEVQAALAACAELVEVKSQRAQQLRQRAEQAEGELVRLLKTNELLAQERNEAVRELQAELAALKARRCETCGKWLEVPSPVNSDLRLCDSWSGETGSSSPVYTSADAGCSFWEEMCP